MAFLIFMHLFVNVLLIKTLSPNGMLTMVLNFGDLGCPKDKLVIGVSFYGLSRILTSEENYGLKAPTTKSINVVRRPNIPYQVSYYEICLALANKSSGWIEEFDNVGKMPYAHAGVFWISYENPRSLKIKTDFIKEKGYGGAMIMDIIADDSQGVCGPNYPLLNTVYQGLNNYALSRKKTKFDIGDSNAAVTPSTR